LYLPDDLVGSRSRSSHHLDFGQQLLVRGELHPPNLSFLIEEIEREILGKPASG